MRRNTNLNKQQAKLNYIIQGWMQIKNNYKESKKIIITKVTRVGRKNMIPSLDLANNYKGYYSFKYMFMYDAFSPCIDISQFLDV